MANTYFSPKIHSPSKVDVRRGETSVLSEMPSVPGDIHAETKNIPNPRPEIPEIYNLSNIKFQPIPTVRRGDHRRIGGTQLFGEMPPVPFPLEPSKSRKLKKSRKEKKSRKQKKSQKQKRTRKH